MKTTPLQSTREQLGLSVQQIATVLGMSRSNYWRIETGRIWPRQEDLQRIVILLRELGVALTIEEILFPKGVVEASARRVLAKRMAMVLPRLTSARAAA